MGLAYLRTMQPVGQYQLVEIVELSAGTPPPRPHPEPPLGIWGPNDPRPSHPIAGIPGLPGGPEWQPPFPVDPGYFPPGVGPGLPGGPGSAGPGQPAYVKPVPPPPEGTPAPTPPAGMPAGSAQVVIWFGPGTTPTKAWVEPYAAQHPQGAAPATPGSLAAKPK